MTEDRKKLIDKFQKWLDTNPRKQIIAAQCATIAEEYHAEQLRLGVVVRQSEQLFCECAQAKGCDIDEDGHLYCIECQKKIAAK
jgi:hypothetical protein